MKGVNMKLTKKDIYEICGCVEAIEACSGLFEDFDISMFKAVFERSLKHLGISISDIENESITWDEDGFDICNEKYYKIYKITLTTNDTFEATIYADIDFNFTRISFNLSQLVIKL